MKKLYVEVANNHISREQGLMGVKSLHRNGGMLFKFPASRRLAFWMKNTYIPLDIAFVNDEGRIIQIEEMVPLSTKSVVARENCRYAIEVNRGWFRENNIAVGDIIGGIVFKKMAQIDPMADILQSIPQQENAVEDVTQEGDPSVELNKTIREMFMDAESRGNDMMIFYQTKAGISLPPRQISPPFRFEPDENGKHDAIVKAWLNQPWRTDEVPGWKSFLIDNIIDLEEIMKE